MSRKKDAVPVVRSHRGIARVRLDGREFYLGRFGSPEAREKADRLIAAWLANGRRLPVEEPSQAPPPALPHLADAPVVVEVTPVAPVTVSVPAVPDGTGLTVGELCSMWLAWIKEKRLPGKDSRDTSIMHGARQASTALRHHWSMLASDFGPRALYEVQETLVKEPCRPAGRRRKDGKKSSNKFRTRSTVNDVVGRVRQLFKWAEGRELVREGKIFALQQVAPIMPGQTTARDNDPKRPVPDEVFEATLPHVPTVVADLLRVVRLSGCRTGEACDLRRADINMTGEVWVWIPPSHKTAWRGHQRVIQIGPKAQAILLPYIMKAEPDAFLFSPRIAVAQRRGRKAGRHIRDSYDTCGVARAITRACERHGITKWSPHQLRHTRLTEVRNQFGIDAAQAVGGHRHIAVTEVYATASQEKAAQAARLTG
jgi:integrase